MGFQKFIFYFCLTLLFQGLNVEALPQLHYVIQPASHPYLCEVKLEVRSIDTSDVKLQIPQSDNNMLISDLYLESEGALVSEQEGGVRVSSCLDTVALSYRIRDTDRINQHWFMLPQGEKTYFHIYGDHLFVVPKLDRSEQIEVTIEWIGWPLDWTIANSLGVQEKIQRFQGELDAFLTTVFVGGDFQILRGEKLPLFFAVRGIVNGYEYLRQIETIISEQRGFWKNENFPYFLVTMCPLGSVDVSCGRGLFHSFSLCPNDHMIKHPEEIFHLVSHEHFHTWNGIEMTPEPYPNLIWFAEGFTEYYAAKLNLTSRVIDRAAFVHRINGWLYKYFISPAKSYSNDEVAKWYSTDDYAWDIDYYRGALLAAAWDQKIQRSSAHLMSLDDLMRRVLDRSRANGGKVTLQMIMECGSQFLSEKEIQDLDKYILLGQEHIPLSLRFSDYELKWMKAADLIKIYGHDTDQLETWVPQFSLISSLE